MNNTIIAILNILNIMAELIELSVFVSVRVIALAIVIGQLTYEGAQVVYNNRQQILENVNNIRHQISRSFSYEYAVS